MANLTKAQRDKLPNADFGDPKKRAYPITDQDDVDSAADLIGKADDPAAVKARIIAIAKRKGLTLPKAWQAAAKMSAGSVLFSEDFDVATEASEDGDMVMRTGKFFEVGKVLTDKNGVKFGFADVDEADAALEQFAPFAINHEHAPSIFDGLLGEVRSLWRDGDSINAEYAFPKALHEHMGGKPIKTSSEWDIATKRPTGAALVMNPAVADAVMMGACKDGLVTPEAVAQFAKTRHNTPAGQIAMQGIHDAATRAGAVCDRTNTAKMASQHEATAIQKIHDMASAHGAVCQSGEAPSWAVSQYSAAKPSAIGEKKMTLIEQLKTAFGLAGVPADKIPDFSEGEAPSGLPANYQAQFAAQAKEIETLRLRDTEREASVFIDSLIVSGQVMPYEKSTLLAQFAQAAKDDSASPTTVKFSALDDDCKVAIKEGNRTDALKGSLAMRLPTGATQELVSTERAVNEDDFKAIFARRSETESKEDRAKRIRVEADAELAARGIVKK